jgi:carbohydrate kinase (thermoresistant glucokinase family)
VAALSAVVVMGVAGSGKSAVGTALAARLGIPFCDADDLHPAANVAKLAGGQALTDADRWPWLARVRAELRRGPVVVACSALRRSYRDMLRAAPSVRFVFLDVDPATARHRAAARAGHFMSPEMVAGQFDTLEHPVPVDEPDVLVVDAREPVERIVDRTMAALPRVPTGRPIEPLVAEAGPDRDIDAAGLALHTDPLAALIAARARRVLLVPPDHTRLHSRAGTIVALLRDRLVGAGCTVGVLPAIGTHAAMTDDDAALLFGSRWSSADLLVHDWQSGLVEIGEIAGAEVAVATGGRYDQPIEVAVDAQLLAGWDLVVSVGQVVPHEVIGMANYTKNLVIGLGGAPTIHRSHFVGAVAGMESIMGRAVSPVRDLVDAAFDRFLAPAVDVMWVLTVVEDIGARTALRGIFAGVGGSAGSGAAAFRGAADLSRRVNVDVVDAPFGRVVCRLDPREFRSTWLGNKAIYRTRMAIADGGELLVLAPGVHRFGEDDGIDGLIRRHGYRTTPEVLDAVAADVDLGRNLGAAAHLIHGSSEGRFRIVYCTDPARGGLSKAEVEAVGYEWRQLDEAVAATGAGPDAATGWRTDSDGQAYFHVANPALGLWSTAARFAT